MRATLDSGCVAAAHVVAETLVVQCVWKNLVISNFLTLCNEHSGMYGVWRCVFFLSAVCFTLDCFGSHWRPHWTSAWMEVKLSLYH